MKSLAFALGLFCIAADTAPSPTYEGITRPSSDISMAFARPGIISEIHVKEGDTVTKGQILAKQNSSVEAAKLLQYQKAQSSTSLLDKANAELEQKRKDVIHMEDALKQKACTEKEVEYARLDVRKAELEAQKAQQDLDMAGLQAKEVEATIKQMSLIATDAGESPESGKEAVRLVCINPLWVEVPIPARIAAKLKTGAKLKVSFGEGQTAREASVIFVSPVADSASELVRVKAQIDNKELRPVGERVRVEVLP
jgi:membrane fusion protein, multidrug efflux system